MGLRPMLPPQVVSSRFLSFPLALLVVQPLCHLSQQFLRGAIDLLGSMLKMRALLLLAVLVSSLVGWLSCLRSSLQAIEIQVVNAALAQNRRSR